ncbi:granulins-like [Mizuhopecten yessoensis]|uniref:granulins-like n=1 Tax=Mizuhopecten yessoensis TaxID=6573 RepID=UPI000B45BAB7|nr:granulins-like [Mizuhopecten yessoensis]
MPCCPHGYPMPRIRCPMARCPPGFSCHTHVVNRWGVCCRATLTINQIRNTVNRNTGIARQMPSVAGPMPGVMPTCTRQSNLPCCQYGQPVGGIDCQVRRCSTGTTCFTHTTGQWAVCCPMSQQQTSRTVVMVAGPMGIGSPSPVMIAGPGFSPGAAPTGPTIPQETQIINMSPSSCSSSSPTACCPNAMPIPGSNCRFEACRSGSTCNVHETDAWAVCCPAPRQRQIEPRPTSCSRTNNVACCEAGQPLTGIQCRVQACPPGYFCNSHFNNRWAVCCQGPNTVVTPQTCSVNDAQACCPRGAIVHGTQCRTRPCLSNQFCHSNPEGRWAVCCLESSATPPGNTRMARELLRKIP